MRETTGKWIGLAKGSAVALCALIAACGGGGGGDNSGGGGGFQISPSTATVPVGGSLQFGGPSGAASWSVDNTPGGNTLVGTIDSTGLYLAPVYVPGATTVADPSRSTPVTIDAPGSAGSATVNVVSRFQVSNPFPVCAVNCYTNLMTYIDNTPNAVAMADLNGDGRSDVITANTASGTISVLAATGPLSLADAEQYDVGDRDTSVPQAIVAGPMNTADTRPDVVVADGDPNSPTPAVRTRLGLGNGTLDSEQSLSLPVGSSDPLSMASGRFTNDAIPDVVVANYSNSTLLVLIGDGSGQFQSPTTLSPTEIVNPLGVAAGDFNQDGFDDLAVASSGNGRLVVLLNKGDGTFQLPPASYMVPGAPSAVAVADFNADSCPDLVVTDAAGDTLSVVLNKPNCLALGAGLTFNTPSQFFATGSEPVAVAAADLNADSFPDVVVVNHAAGTIRTYFGETGGVLTPAETYRVGLGPQAVAVGDVDNDGWPDFAVANSGDDTVTVFRNRGDSTTP